MKSHVLPQALFKNTGALPNMVVSTEADVRLERSTTGFYGRFLCAVCEASFAKTDSAFVAWLRGVRERGQPVRWSTGASGLQFPAVDAEMVLRFLVSVLFRADACVHRFFRNVELGPLRDELRAALRGPGSIPARFDAVLLLDVSDLAGMMFHPTRLRVGTINAYRFCVGALEAIVKVDRQPFPKALRTVSVRHHSGALFVLHRDERSPREWAVVAELIERHDAEIERIYAAYGVDPRAM